MNIEPYPLTPRKVPFVKTKHRCIKTAIPVPESIAILEKLHAAEPRSMQGQPPIIWDRAEGIYIFDKWGNQWLDFSSGVLVTNAGHGRKEIRDAMIHQIDHGLLHNYCFPSEIRMQCCEKILSIAPPYLNKVFLLTTGSEATENALKLARTWGQKHGGPKKNIMISFENAFHGRTLGSQMMGGSPGLKEWIVHHDPELIQIPFPDGYYQENVSFDLFLNTLQQKGINPDNVCGVITETYQGGGADFLPIEYVQKLRQWCTNHQALLIFDEVQAGFGRTGKMFGFQHYGVEADLVCMGKGLSSGLPASGVLGRKEIMDLYPPGSMTSTHTGNPVVCASVIANIDLILQEKLVDNAASVGELMLNQLQGIVSRHAVAGVCHGKGLVAGLQIVKPGTKIPDKELAFEICKRIIEKGVMLFSPVGKATLKISPPLCMTPEAVTEGCQVIEEAITEICLEKGIVDKK